MPRASRRCPGDKGRCTNLIRYGQRYCDEHTRAWVGERTASSRATSTTGWKQLRLDVLRRDGHRCQIGTEHVCVGIATVVDKIIPAASRPDLARGERNLRAACAPCNDAKARTTDKQAVARAH